MKVDMPFKQETNQIKLFFFILPINVFDYPKFNVAIFNNPHCCENPPLRNVAVHLPCKPI